MEAPTLFVVSAEGRVYLVLVIRGITVRHHHGGEHVSGQAGGAGAQAERSQLPPPTATSKPTPQ